MSEISTRYYLKNVDFTSDGKKYNFSVKYELSQEGRGKEIYIGEFLRAEGSEYANETVPEGLNFNTLYCLKKATVLLPVRKESYPQERQFWDFFPFEGENLRKTLALNDSAKAMVESIANGTLNPFGEGDRIFYSPAVIEPVYAPVNIDEFSTCSEKIDCMLQIISGLKQLMSNKALNDYNIVAHRDMKFKNVMVEYKDDGTRQIHIIDFPSVKLTSKERTETEMRTCLGFFSVENTAPEDVRPGFSVSTKTDVFALGTMLAEIFKIWDYDETKNPLSLLFKVANSIDLSDAKQCCDFFMKMDKNFPFENTDKPGWLEKALAAHDKNAAWDKIDLICPDIRRLFRAATAINPANRITLNRLEEELKRIQRNLKPLDMEEDEEMEQIKEKTTYFLVDTTQKNSYCDAYILDMQKVLESIGNNTKVVILPYASSHIAEPLHADNTVLEMKYSEQDEIGKYLKSLPETYRGKMGLSNLKKCLHNLLVYLQNNSNRTSFNGEIHIFAPDAPSEENLHRFSLFERDVTANITEKYFSGEELWQNFSLESDKIYVHTFDDDGAASRDRWYSLVPLSVLRPMPLTAEPSKTKSYSMDLQPKANIENAVLRKGKGFHFIGGSSTN